MKFKEYLLNESKKIIGYVSLSKKVKLGTFLNPSKKSIDMTEKFVEKIRKEKFSDKPSRIGAIFVSPTLKAVKNWKFHGGDFIYKVEIDGNYHIADGEIYTNIDTDLDDGNMELAEKDTIKYWQGKLPYKRLIEIIIQGKVKILEEIY